MRDKETVAWCFMLVFVALVALGMFIQSSKLKDHLLNLQMDAVSRGYAEWRVDEHGRSIEWKD